MTLQAHQLIFGIAFAFILASASWRLRLLTISGAVAAWIVGAVVFVCGGWIGSMALLTFFATSNLLGRFRRRQKEALGFEKGGRRDAYQVLANGGVAAGFLLAGIAIPSHHAALFVGTLAAIAEANADTWATEIGAAIGRSPRMITTGKVAPSGTSGAVTAYGLVASFLGAALIATFEIRNIRSAIDIMSCGFAGAIFDSILGATIQANYVTQDGILTEKKLADSCIKLGFAYINNDAVNALSALFSALLAYLLLLQV